MNSTISSLTQQALTHDVKLAPVHAEGDHADYEGVIRLAPAVILDVRLSRSKIPGKSYLSLSLGFDEPVELALTDKDADAVIAASAAPTDPNDMTPQQLRAAGYVVAIWGPKELRSVRATSLDDHVMAAGNEYIAERIEQMDAALEDRIMEHLQDAGYSGREIEQGIAYAVEQGYEDDDQALSLVLGRILYSDDQLAAGSTYAVEPGSW